MLHWWNKYVSNFNFTSRFRTTGERYYFLNRRRKLMTESKVFSKWVALVNMKSYSLTDMFTYSIDVFCFSFLIIQLRNMNVKHTWMLITNWDTDVSRKQIFKSSDWDVESIRQELVGQETTTREQTASFSTKDRDTK